MAVTIQWDETRSTIHYRINGRWNWLELRQKAQMSAALVLASSRPVNLLIDLTGAYGLSRNRARHLLRLLVANIAPNPGRIVIVSSNPDDRNSLVAAYGHFQLEGWEITLVETPGQALSILNESLSEASVPLSSGK